MRYQKPPAVGWGPQEWLCRVGGWLDRGGKPCLGPNGHGATVANLPWGKVGAAAGGKGLCLS